MNKQSFIAELHATHQPVSVAVEALTDEAWTEASPGMDGWTRKNVLAHVGWWTDHSVRVITALRAGGVPYERDPGFDIDENGLPRAKGLGPMQCDHDRRRLSIPTRRKQRFRSASASACHAPPPPVFRSRLPRPPPGSGR
jgi:hypothetical protein